MRRDMLVAVCSIQQPLLSRRHRSWTRSSSWPGLSDGWPGGHDQERYSFWNDNPAALEAQTGLSAGAGM